MSDSSDDLELPGMSAASPSSLRPRGPPPQRLRNFKAMISDSSDDDDVSLPGAGAVSKRPPPPSKRGPSPGSKSPGSAPAPKTRPAPKGARKGLPDIGSNSATPTASPPVMSPATAAPVEDIVHRTATDTGKMAPETVSPLPKPAAPPATKPTAGDDDGSDTSVQYNEEGSTSDNDDQSATTGTLGGSESFRLTPSNSKNAVSESPGADTQQDQRAAVVTNEVTSPQPPQKQPHAAVDTSNMQPVSSLVDQYTPKTQRSKEEASPQQPPAQVQEQPIVQQQQQPQQQQQQEPPAPAARKVPPPPPAADSDDEEAYAILPRDSPAASRQQHQQPVQQQQQQHQQPVQQQQAVVSQPEPQYQHPQQAYQPPIQEQPVPQQQAQPVLGNSPRSQSPLAVRPAPAAYQPAALGGGDDSLEHLLLRAQQRMRQREAEDELRKAAGPNGPIGAPLNTSIGSTASRGNSPGPMRRSTPTTPAAPQLDVSSAALLAGPNASGDFASARLQRENARLSNELALLTREVQQLKGTNESGAPGTTRAATSATVSKLELEVEVLKGLEAQARSAKMHLETQLADSNAHERAMREELSSYASTVEKFESSLAAKDEDTAREAAEAQRLRQELAERRQELNRQRDDFERTRQDDTIRLERTTALLEDAKKQRVHLTELNDKFLRDKESALAERRRVQDELKALQTDVSRERERHADELSQTRRDLERLKASASEKERAFGTQLADERRAKELYQTKHAEVEEQLHRAQGATQEAVSRTREECKSQVADLKTQMETMADQLANAQANADRVAAAKSDEAMRAVHAENQKLQAKLEAAEVARDDALMRADRAETTLGSTSQERMTVQAELSRALNAAEQWQAAKEQSDAKLSKVEATLKMLLLGDDKLTGENASLRAELDQAHADLNALRSEVESCFRLEQQLQQLSTENDRLSEECARHARERNELVKENGRMAEEMVSWRQEVRELLGRRGQSGAAVGASGLPLAPISAAPSPSAPRDFTF